MSGRGSAVKKKVDVSRQPDDYFPPQIKCCYLDIMRRCDHEICGKFCDSVQEAAGVACKTICIRSDGLGKFRFDATQERSHHD